MRWSHVRRVLLSAGLVSGLLATAGSAQAALTQVPVKNNPFVNEVYGAASDTWLVFTRNSSAHPRDYALYADGTVVGRRRHVSYVARGRPDAALLSLQRGLLPTPKAFTLLAKSLDGSPLPPRVDLQLGDLDFF